MVKRKNRKYFLTAFGKIVYDGHVTIKKAAENDYRLKGNRFHGPVIRYYEV